MTKLATAFGDKYQQSAISIRTKSFELGGHTFKVRVPLNKEIEEMDARMATVDAEKLEARFQKIAAPFKAGEPTDGVIVTDDDVTVEGRSCRELAKSALEVEQRIVEYTKLLVVENGDLSDLTYEDIDTEFPFQIQVELMSKITESIQPGYKETRKN